MNTLLSLVVLLATPWCRARNLDQRQEGKVNVQIDVKDVQILALVDNDMIEDYIQNYDYAYDYNDFTIKPGSRPTKVPTTSTPKPTTPATVQESTSLKLNLTEGITNSPVHTIIVNNTAGSDIKVIIEDNKTDKPEQLATEGVFTSSPVVPASSPESRKRCPAGFQLKSGRCFKRRLSMISPRFAIMKLAPGLLNKSKVTSLNVQDESS